MGNRKRYSTAPSVTRSDVKNILIHPEASFGFQPTGADTPVSMSFAASYQRRCTHCRDKRDDGESRGKPTIASEPEPFRWIPSYKCITPDCTSSRWLWIVHDSCANFAIDASEASASQTKDLTTHPHATLTLVKPGCLFPPNGPQHVWRNAILVEDKLNFAKLGSC